MSYPYLSPFLHYQLSCLKQSLASSKWKELLQKNIDLKNKYQGKRCFILGTAPSISDYDLTKIKDECLIAINEIYLHPDFDIVFNSQPENKFIVLPPTHASIEEQETLHLLSEIQQKISPRITLFLGLDNFPCNYHYLVKKHELFKHHELQYFSTGIQTQLGWYRFSKKHWDLSRNIWSSSVGSVYALLIALYLGFDEIYLLGIDHSYLSFNNPASYRFYGENSNLKRSREIKRNEEIHRKSQNTIILEGTHLAFEQYNLISENTTTGIFNLSKQSILDIFPRKEFDEVISS
jgi:hypothetical protein